MKPHSAKGILLQQVRVTIMTSQPHMPLTQVNHLAKQILSDLFQSENWEAVQIHTNQVVYNALPDKDEG